MCPQIQIPELGTGMEVDRSLFHVGRIQKWSPETGTGIWWLLSRGKRSPLYIHFFSCAVVQREKQDVLICPAEATAAAVFPSQCPAYHVLRMAGEGLLLAASWLALLRGYNLSWANPLTCSIWSVLLQVGTWEKRLSTGLEARSLSSVRKGYCYVTVVYPSTFFTNVTCLCRVTL